MSCAAPMLPVPTVYVKIVGKKQKAFAKAVDILANVTTTGIANSAATMID